MKLALVKQDVYQDLYVCPTGLSARETLFSSAFRVGPIGLFTLLDTDFYIVQEEAAPECQIWKKVIPGMEEKCRQLKRKTGGQWKGIQQVHSNGDFSVNCREVDWSAYDVVISVNCSVPTAIVQQHPQVLWAYMIGEANVFSDKVYFGYDVCLNQEIRGIAYGHVNVLDFPYTFAGPCCLEKLLYQHLQRPSAGTGVFAEVNTTEERPVRQVPHFQPIAERTGHPVIIHQPHIADNLQALYDARYFVKVGGRMIRGNSVIEAISTGTLVLMNPLDLGCSQILPKETWVHSVEEAIKKIHYLDKYPEEYNRLLHRQRSLVQQFVVDYPLKALEHAWQQKIRNPVPRKAESITKALLKSRIKNILVGS